LWQQRIQPLKSLYRRHGFFIKISWIRNVRLLGQNQVIKI
ncbi:MAG: hypothetical protein RL311_1253, partial [Bacteroidota bacterium]